MSALTFDELRAANVRRCETSFHTVTDWSPCDWITCITGELGELASEVKKLRRGQDVPLEKLAYEMADVQAYLDLLAAALGIDLGEATRDKFNIVSARVGSEVTL